MIIIIMTMGIIIIEKNNNGSNNNINRIQDNITYKVDIKWYNHDSN